MLITKGICVEFERQNITSLVFFYFQIACNYYTSFMTNPLNIIFDDFGR